MKFEIEVTVKSLVDYNDLYNILVIKGLKKEDLINFIASLNLPIDLNKYFVKKYRKL